MEGLRSQVCAFVVSRVPPNRPVCLFLTSIAYICLHPRKLLPLLQVAALEAALGDLGEAKQAAEQVCVTVCVCVRACVKLSAAVAALCSGCHTNVEVVLGR